MTRNPADSWLAERIAQVVEKYEDVLLPEERSWIADRMFDIFADDERCAELLRHACPIFDAEAKVEAPPSDACRAFDLLGLRWTEKEPDLWVCELGTSTFEILIVLDAAFFAFRAGDDLHSVVDLGSAAPVRALLNRCATPRISWPLN